MGAALDWSLFFLVVFAIYGRCYAQGVPAVATAANFMTTTEAMVPPIGYATYRSYNRNCPGLDPDRQYSVFPGEHNRTVGMLWEHRSHHDCLAHGFFATVEDALKRATQDQWEVKALFAMRPICYDVVLERKQIARNEYETRWVYTTKE